MAGGTWELQNKVRAGVYVRFKAKQAAESGGVRGVVAICEPLSWGAVSTVQEITSTTDLTDKTGYSDLSAEANRFLREIFRGTNRTSGAKKVLLYRPAATSSVAASATIGNLTVTAKYHGTRGNDITVAVVANGSAYDVETYVDGSLVDSQTVSAISALTANAWVTFSGTGSLSASAGTALTGGANGTVASSAYTAFLTAIEGYKFNVLCYDGTDSTTMTAYKAFVERMVSESGVHMQMVVANMTTPDSIYVINLINGLVLDDGTTLTAAQACWWVAGAEAGANYNESLTFAKHPAAVAVSPVKTNAQIITALNAGQMVFTAEDGDIFIEKDINSRTTYTSTIKKSYSQNRVVRMLATIANDIYALFRTGYIGVVGNSATGRERLKSGVCGLMIDYQNNEGIQDFDPDAVTVSIGEEADAVVIELEVTPVQSVDKIYMSITVAA